ncbi:hypothetical protein M378DRAFT_384596 [Amanita muscaria Koide BX008]|uniref:Uncharacterized protein n=1 Tax=Amanita muscaria (strain Koide BX008) TaxID=946122 RepID=A0A0C2XAJ0_AMAMK|nr:hypothetical protein M378DRAFT_384596 [Amanita muscaria Koide BX008]
MKYCGAKASNEKWSPSNAVHSPTGLLHYTTTAGTTYLYEKQPEPELGQSDVALAPINHLPDDVLCYIFTLHCREKIDAVRLPFNHSNVPPQVVISHVCSVWRHAILNFSSLWNDLEVFMDCAEDGDMLMKIVHDWLFRAGSLPCTLTLDFRVYDGTLGALKQDRWYSSIVKHLISQFRFRKLSTPWSSNHLAQFLQLPAEKLSCVEDLHICLINPPSLSNFGVLPSQAPLDSFKKLTRLTSLRLDQSLRRVFYGLVHSEDSVFVHVPWHQIRHIHLSIPTSVLLCFTILHGSSMVLETCSLVVAGCYGPWDEIQSLFHSPPILDPFLLWIKMPNLKALEIGSGDRSYRRIVSFSTLVDMQYFSNMKLEEFGYYKHSRTMDVGHLLTTFPSLKRVEVLAWNLLDNGTISQLGSGLIAPCLEELVIRCCDINIGKLLRMVKGRSALAKRDGWQKNGPTPFRYVKLYWEEILEDYYKESIEEINRYYDVQLIVEPWT